MIAKHCIYKKNMGEGGAYAKEGPIETMQRTSFVSSVACTRVKVGRSIKLDLTRSDHIISVCDVRVHTDRDDAT